ncbi:MAG: hypothetical protein J3R72DRAFT_436597 [Linnemannia gamsii]|nr:MAG: hypothetical protein J3R72DRAFT_436597 [Linnemannia gamsii]
MHLTSALSLLTVMAFAVQFGNACTAKECTKIVRELNLNNVPFCGSKVAKCPKEFGYSAADPNTIYTISNSKLREKLKCVAPFKCIEGFYVATATCECKQATGRIFIPGSKQCWDAPYLDVGELVALYACDTALHPNWAMTGDNKIKNVDSHLCVGQRLYSGSPYPQLILEHCDESAVQWTIENNGRIKNKDGSCVDVGANEGHFTRLTLPPCNSGANQQWTRPTWTCHK